MLLLFLFTFSIHGKVDSNFNNDQQEQSLLNLPISQENGSTLITEVKEDQCIQDPDFLRKAEVVLLFNGWTPKGDNSKSIEKLHEVFSKNTPTILDFSNKYLKEEEDSVMPIFDSDRVADEILERIISGKKVWLVGYSEGSIGLLKSIIKVADKCKKENLLQDFYNLVRISVIDPPSRRFFSFQIQSLDFWFINLVASWAKWIAGIAPNSKLSDRRFPVLSDAFLSSFRWFWKNLIVPISKKQRANDKMFYRAAFVKERAIALQQKIATLDPEDAAIIKAVSTVYLQSWRDEEGFSKIGSIRKLKYKHTEIRKGVMREIEQIINI